MIDFPLFERDEDTGQWTFVHHPFTAPDAGHEDGIESDPGAALSQHYDLIWNGWELGSGSIRIHARGAGAGLPGDGAVRRGGAGEVRLPARRAPRWARRRTAASRSGIERFVALMAGEPDIRQVIAFPKVSSGSDPLTGAPTPMPAGSARANSESR